MAVTWQSHGTLLGSAAGDLTPTNPAHAVDDILILHAASRLTTETLATPSGWTIIGSASDTTNWRHYVYWIRATSAAMTNPLNDWTAGAAGEKYAQVSCLRGAVKTGDPFAAVALTAGTADPGAATGVTTTAADQFVLTHGIVADNLATAVTVTATDPTSFTQRSYTTIATGADAGQFATDATRRLEGATGNISHDFNGVPLAWGILAAAVLEDPLLPELVMPPRIAV